MFRKKKARKKRSRRNRFWTAKFWTGWRLAIGMSFCLNVFGVHSYINKIIKTTPAIQRHFTMVTVDGYWYRLCTWLKSFK